MKNYPKLTSVLSIAVVLSTLYSCSKSNQVTPTPAPPAITTAVAPGHHVYGLLPTTPEEYASIPIYNREDFQAKHALNSINTPAPAVLTLATPAIRDQGQLGSCTGFCGTEAYEILWNYKYGTFPPILSPAFLYYEERVNILKEKIGADNGANMVNIDQALTKYGITTEALYAYPSSDKSTAYKTPPSANAISTALGYKISSYTLINTGDTAAVKNCLRNHIPVMMGLNVYDNTRTYAYFEGLTNKSYTYNPLTAAGKLVSGLTLMGGHATPIVGYDDTKQAFLVQNSWGSSWGLSGFYYMPYSVFASTKIVPQGGVYFATL